MRRKARPEPLKPSSEPTWLAVRDRLSRVVSGTALTPNADLQAVLMAAREARIEQQWDCGDIGSCGVLLLQPRRRARDGEHRDASAAARREVLVKQFSGRAGGDGSHVVNDVGTKPRAARRAKIRKRAVGNARRAGPRSAIRCPQGGRGAGRGLETPPRMCTQVVSTLEGYANATPSRAPAVTSNTTCCLIASVE